MAKVLISGASVAGPALAYWLQRYGFEVTVVERAPAVRAGGYPIDLRGTAIDAADRMGLLPALRARHIETRRLTVCNGGGAPIASVDSDALPGGDPHRHLELPRGELTALLYGLTERTVEYRFDDSITALEPSSGRVSFERGATESYDVIVGADGLHSNTRRLAFGPEESFQRYLGCSFAGFQAPNSGGLSHEVILQNRPGRAVAIYAVRSEPWVHALLCSIGSPPPRHETVEQTRARLTGVFADFGGDTPRLLTALGDAEDLYCDTVSQITMPTWSTGRVVVLGDAAYAPSFFSGQGTSLALTGAYVLAGELALGDVPTALAAYERRMRDHVVQNQALASGGRVTILPGTRGQLWLRNTAFRLAPLLTRLKVGDRLQTSATESLVLPEYSVRMGR